MISTGNKVSYRFSLCMIGDALRWKSQLRYFEEIFYQLTLCYMYILNNLLRFKFDIGKAMRAKLVLKLHSNKRSIKCSKNSMLVCIYAGYQIYDRIDIWF